MKPKTKALALALLGKTYWQWFILYFKKTIFQKKKKIITFVLII